MAHYHDPQAGTQNQGNSLGTRSCVRQSKLFRQYESGNDVKGLLGQAAIQWDVNRKQGAYDGAPVYDAARNAPTFVANESSVGGRGARRRWDDGGCTAKVGVPLERAPPARLRLRIATGILRL